MAVTVVVGLQWGDEGKGKIVDLLSQDFDIIARFNGGKNAGHTVVIGQEKYILHLIPSGILRPGKICILGNSIVIDPKALLDEMDSLKKRGIEVDGRLFVSDRAHLTLPYHFLLEEAEEEKRGPKRIDTTRKGIGPTYTDKARRIGIRASDLLNPDLLKEKIREISEEKNFLLKNFYGKDGFDPEETIEAYLNYAKRLSPLITDTSLLINRALDEGKDLLGEGAQGTLLDIEFGTYPFDSSSLTTAGGACSGLGIGPTLISGVLGVAKAYTTRVGNGPFPTEQDNEIGERMRERGGEYGATTGRARRCGWFDGVGVRFAVMVNGITSLIITKLDVLDDFETLYICTGYKYKDEVIKNFPAQTDILWEVEPIYEELEGWKEPTGDIRRYEDLPPNAQNYLGRISELTDTEISLVSVGPEREQTVSRLVKL